MFHPSRIKGRKRGVLIQINSENTRTRSLPVVPPRQQTASTVSQTRGIHRPNTSLTRDIMAIIQNLSNDYQGLVCQAQISKRARKPVRVQYCRSFLGTRPYALPHPLATARTQLTLGDPCRLHLLLPPGLRLQAAALSPVRSHHSSARLLNGPHFPRRLFILKGEAWVIPLFHHIQRLRILHLRIILQTSTQRSSGFRLAA